MLAVARNRAKTIPKKKIHYAKVEILNQLAIGAFIVGVLLLGFFVGYNLWFGQRVDIGSDSADAMM